MKDGRQRELLEREERLKEAKCLQNISNRRKTFSRAAEEIQEPEQKEEQMTLRLLFNGESFKQKLSEELSKLNPEFTKQEEARGCSGEHSSARNKKEFLDQKRPLQAGDKEEGKGLSANGCAPNLENETPPNLLPPPHGLFLPSCCLSTAVQQSQRCLIKQERFFV